MASNARKRAVPAAPDLDEDAMRELTLRDLKPFTPEELADFLGVDEKTLERWRREDPDGPAFFRMPKGVRYRVQAIDRWMRDRERATRAQVAA